MCSDGRCQFAAENSLAYHRVWPMEARQFNYQSLWLVPDYQVYYPLLSSSICHDRQQSHHVLPQPVAAVDLFGDLGLCQENDIEAADMYHLYGLCNTKPPSIADVEVPDG